MRYARKCRNTQSTRTWVAESLRVGALIYDPGGHTIRALRNQMNRHDINMNTIDAISVAAERNEKANLENGWAAVPLESRKAMLARLFNKLHDRADELGMLGRQKFILDCCLL